MMTRAIGVSMVVLAASGCAIDDEPELGSVESSLDISVFTLPSLTDAERAEIVHRYDAIDPTDQVPRGLLEDALVYLDVNGEHIPKQRYIAIADMSKYSGKDRYWLVDLMTGAVEPHKVAHGDGSDPDNNGYATAFGNTDGSHMTSLGFYLTGEIYDGTHPHSMRLDGLSIAGSPNNMANTNARPRLIVMHEASYVDDTSTSQQGRSNGCLALDPSIEVDMVDRIHDGSLIYVATKPLAVPVGRCGAACDDPGQGSGSGSDDPPADDPSMDDPGMDDPGSAGCSAGGGASGIVIALGFAGVLRRRAQRPSSR